MPATVPPAAAIRSAAARQRAAGREHVVDEEHPPARRARPTGTSMLGRAVLELVRATARSAAAACRPCAPAPARSPARGASAAARRKPRASTPATRSTGRAAAAMSASARDRPSPNAGAVGEQRGDVLEQDPGLREVRDVAQPGRDRQPRRRSPDRSPALGGDRLRPGAAAAAPAPAAGYGGAAAAAAASSRPGRGAVRPAARSAGPLGRRPAWSAPCTRARAR